MGMEKLFELMDRARSMDGVAIAAQAIENKKETLLDLNKEQLLHGKNNEGSTLGKYKNNRYAAKKNSLNPLPGLGIKDHKLTGSYYKGIFAKIEGGKIIFGSTDEKAKYLETGKDYGLNAEYKTDFVRILNPEFIQQIKSYLKLK